MNKIKALLFFPPSVRRFYFTMLETVAHRKLLKISLCIFVPTLIFGFLASTAIFNSIIRQQFTLKQGRILRSLYLKYPISLDFRVYFFNVTNPEAVQNGATPILHETGPFCYDLYKERINVVDDEEDDTLTYTPYDAYIFDQACSGSLKETDYVTIVHPIIASMVNIVDREFPKYLPMLNKALGSIFKNNSDIFLHARVSDILFDGMLLDCSSPNFATMAVCAQMESKVPGLKQIEKDVFGLSILGARNHTLDQNITVSRGIQSSKSLGRVNAINNQIKLELWSSDECNTFHGTDGWIFPPLSQTETTLWIHSSSLCRNLHADYVESTTLHHVPVTKYYADFGDATSNTEDQCYCPSPDVCLPKGVFDAYKCMKTPIYISLPHFLRSDPKLLKQTQGLQPELDKHIIRVVFEGIFAIPLEAQIRVQFNLPIRPMEKIDLMKSVPDVLHPIMWIELGITLKGGYLKLLQAVFIWFKIWMVIKYLLLIGSTIGLLFVAVPWVQKKYLGNYTVKIADNSPKIDLSLPRIPTFK